MFKNIPFFRTSIALLILFSTCTNLSAASNPYAKLIEQRREAILNDNIDEMEEILKQGMPVNIQDNLGWTALHEAVVEQDFYMVKFLLDHGANPNIKENHGETALHKAAKNAFISILQLLLNHGANADIEDQIGETAICKAHKYNQDENVKLLFKSFASHSR